MRSTNSLAGIARSPGSRSTNQSSLDTEFILNLASLLREPINGRLAAVRRLAYEAADAGLLSPVLAASIRRVKGRKMLGVRLGNWLTANEARSLWQAPNPESLKGKRDQVLLATLLGCGLRRRRMSRPITQARQGVKRASVPIVTVPLLWVIATSCGKISC